MYLKWTSEFIKFIADQDHGIEEVLAHLVLRVLAPIGATSAFVSQLDNQNSIVMIGRFGIPLEISNSYQDRFSLNDNLPITDAIRLRKLVAINSLPNWPEEYSEILSQPYASDESALIAFPIERCGTPVGVVAVFLNSKIVITPEIEIFIGSIANLLALYLFSKVGQISEPKFLLRDANFTQNSEQGTELTQRQLLILRMMSEGRTNISISEILKYSESTIRQETIRIFSKLGCDGREDATKIYNANYLIKSQKSEITTAVDSG